MNGSGWTRFRIAPLGVTLSLVLCVAGGMSGGTCMPSLTPTDNTTPSATSLPAQPPQAQPNLGGGKNTPPSVTFGWPVAPVTIQSGTSVTIQWTVKDPEDSARVSIFARDSLGSDVVLASGVAGTPPSSTHSFVWSTGTIASGTYNIVAQASDGKNDVVTVLSPGSVTIMSKPTGSGNPPPPPPPPNTAPTISFVLPSADVTIDAGSNTPITWQTQDLENGVTVTIVADPDDSDTNTNGITLVNQRVESFSSSPVTDTFSWNTSVNPGTYRIIGTVNDGTNITGHVVSRTAVGKITVIPVGTGNNNGAPSVSVSQPESDVGVSQGDQIFPIFTVSDPDANTATGLMKDSIALTYYFDTDTDPTNDATSPPIQVGTDTIPSGQFPPNTQILDAVIINIDTTLTPVREETDEGGRPLPYFLRVKADDGAGGTANAYAAGAVRVLGSAADVVDLQALAGTIAGARFQGFNGEPFAEARGSRAGSAFAAMGDVDLDGIADLAIAAQFATPDNRPNVGAVFLIYGRERALNAGDIFANGRYAGVIGLNTVGTFVPFPPTSPLFQTIFNVRGTQLYHPAVGPQGSQGITSLAAWPDITGDFTPELVIGAPFNDTVVDHEDDDPCDICVYPTSGACAQGPILCMVNPLFVPDTDKSIEQFQNVTVPANIWLGPNGLGDNPNGPAPILPVVDMGLDATRVTQMVQITMHIEGDVTGAPNANLPYTLLTQMEYSIDTGIVNPTPPPPTLVMQAPQVTLTTMVATDNMGLGHIITGQTLAFPDAKYVPPSLLPPQFPTLTTAPPAAPNTSPKAGQIPISAWDGKFNVLLKPTLQTKFTTVDVHMAAVIASQEVHPMAQTYNDGFPNERSSVVGCDGMIPAPVDLLGASEMSPAIPPFNDDRFSNINTSGYLCGDFQIAQWEGGQGAQSPGFDRINNPPDGYNASYQAGLVYVCAGDDMVLVQNPQTFQWIHGLRTAEIGAFGQGPTTDNWRGCRFRGPWWNPAGFFDPTSQFGRTVDVIPDFADPDGTTGLDELIVSAPNTAMAQVGQATLAGLTGIYTPGQVRTAGYVLKDLQGNSLPFNSFSTVTAAQLIVTGTAARGARLRIEINGQTAPTSPDTTKDVLFWPGDTNLNDDLELTEFFNAPFGINETMRFPRAAFQFMTSVDTTAAPLSQIRMTFLDPTSATYHGPPPPFGPEPYPGPIDSASLTITSAVLRVTGTVASWGAITVFEGLDWTSDITGDGNDQGGGSSPPMSWPGATCGTCFSRVWDPGNGGPREMVVNWTGEAFGDNLGWAHNANDVNQDGVADIVCGEPGSDNNPLDPNTPFGGPSALLNNGKAFLIYGTPVLPNGTIGQAIHIERFEVRGSHSGDGFGQVQGGAGDFGGTAAPDCFFAAPNYDNDGKIAGIPATGVDAGFVGVLFGNSTLTGERTVACESIGKGNFLGCKFVGGSAGVQLGGAVSTAGDFNLDGKDDLLITSPGQTWPGAKVAFVGPVLNGDKVNINGNVFEFDTDGVVGNGSIRIDVSGIDPATGGLKTLPVSAEAALRKAMKALAVDQLGVSAVLSRTAFPPPEPNDPTTIFLARKPTVFAASSTGANIKVTTFVRQGATYLIFGQGGNALVNKTFILPDDLNRVVNGQRILKGVAFVSAYERNDPRDPNDPEGVDAGSLTVNFDPGGVQVADAAPYAAFAGGTEQVIANPSQLASGTQGYRIQAGTDATITFVKPLCQIRSFFTFDPASNATGATMTAFDPDGNQVNQVSANAVTAPGDPNNFVTLASEGSIASIVIHVTGAGGGIAVIDDFKFNDSTPDEAPVEVVSAIGDVDGDGFPDIILGAPRADFINILEPCNRRKAAGEAYLVYGNNFGLNDSRQP